MENKIEKISIRCGEKIVQLDKLHTLLHNFRDTYQSYQRMTESESTVFHSLYEIVDNEEKVLEKAQNDLKEFFKSKIGKYWKLEMIVHYSDGRDCSELYVIYPYMYINENNHLFCVKTNDLYHSDYSCHFMASGWDIDYFFKGDVDIEMTEITYEEFIETATKGIKHVIDYRLNREKEKLESFNG